MNMICIYIKLFTFTSVLEGKNLLKSAAEKYSSWNTESWEGRPPVNEKRHEEKIHFSLDRPY
jgi:hypothetical protein